LKGLSYRASADYAVASRGAYVVGPLQGLYIYDQAFGYGNFKGAPELNPVDQFRVTVGLQYDFGGSK
jgi:hypothetical protein